MSGFCLFKVEGLCQRNGSAASNHSSDDGNVPWSSADLEKHNLQHQNNGGGSSGGGGGGGGGACGGARGGGSMGLVVLVLLAA